MFWLMANVIKHVRNGHNWMNQFSETFQGGLRGFVEISTGVSSGLRKIKEVFRGNARLFKGFSEMLIESMRVTGEYLWAFKAKFQGISEGLVEAFQRFSGGFRWSQRKPRRIQGHARGISRSFKSIQGFSGAFQRLVKGS